MILLSAAVFIPLGFALGKSSLNTRILWTMLTHRSSISYQGQLLESPATQPESDTSPDNDSISAPPEDRIPGDSDHTGS